MADLPPTPLLLQWNRDGCWDYMLDGWMVAAARMHSRVDAGESWLDITKAMPPEVEPGVMPLGELLAYAYAVGRSMQAGHATAKQKGSR